MIIILGSTKGQNGTIRRGETVYDSAKNVLGTVRNIYKYDLSGISVNVLGVDGTMKKYNPEQLYKG